MRLRVVDSLLPLAGGSRRASTRGGWPFNGKRRWTVTRCSPVPQHSDSSTRLSASSLTGTRARGWGTGWTALVAHPMESHGRASALGDFMRPLDGAVHLAAP